MINTKFKINKNYQFDQNGSVEFFETIKADGSRLNYHILIHMSILKFKLYKDEF